MTAKNDITGDAIKSKILSKQGRDNYDNIFRKTPEEWVKILFDNKLIFHDHDGFQWDDGVTWESKMSRSEFESRLCHCCIEDLSGKLNYGQN